MRVTNAKLTDRSGGHSKRNAKRSVLLALLIATGSPALGPGSFVYGQWPTQSRFQQSNPAPKIVRQGAKISPTMKMGAVRINPFVRPADPSQSAQSTTQNGSDVRAQMTLKSAPGSAGLSTIGGSPVAQGSAAIRPSAGSMRPGLAPTNSPIRENSHFAQNAPGNVSDRPLVQIGQGNVVPVVPAEAIDRLSNAHTGNAFATQRQHGEVLLPVVPAPGTQMSSPVPLAITPNSAEPIGSAPAYSGTNRRAVPIGVSSDASRVVPVADARDDQAVIKETQPIFFTLSDDSAPAPEAKPADEVAENVIEQDPAKDPTKPVKDATPVPATTAADSVAESDQAASETASKSGDQVKDDSEAEPNLESDEKTSERTEESGEQAESAPAPLANVETPVKLAPVLNFADELASEAASIAANEPADGRTSQNVNESSEETDGDDHGLVAIAKRSVPTTKTPRIGSKPVGVTQLKRDAVAVATPPIQVERLERLPAGTSAAPVAKVIVKPALDPATIDPSRLPEPKIGVEQSPREVGFAPVARKSVSTELSELPTVAERPAAAPSLISAPPKVSAVVKSPAPAKVSKVPAALPTLPPAARRLEGAVTVKPVDASKLEQSVDGTTPALVNSPVQFNPTKGVARPAKRGIVTPARLASSQKSESRNALGESAAPSLQSSPDNGRHNVLLQLSRAQVRSMTIGGRLRRVEIADKDVCQAFASSANQIKLIGTGIGTTKLTIWADIVPGEPTRVQTFDVDVSETVDATGEKVAEHTALLNDSIDRAFPRASVVVSRRGGELLVTGRCDDEATAKQIIRMVRKSCLVPVQDNLNVRR